jgi:exopolysaccharide production protein ExoZ
MSPAAISPRSAGSLQLASIQYARAAAALLVLLYHVATTLDGAGDTSPSERWLAPFRWFGFAGVDLFFVISGVVMTVTCYARLGDARQIVPFLKRRVARIYPLYWACFAAVVAIAAAAPQLVTRDKLNGEHILKSALLWPQRDYPIVAVAWTLSFEMYFYLAFAALMTLPRRAFVPALGAWAVAVVALAVAWHDPAYTGLRGNLQPPLFASPLALEFIAGCVVGLAFCRRAMPAAGSATALGAALFVGAGGYFGAVQPEQAAYGLARVAVYGTASALLLYGVVGLELAGRVSTSRALTFWGDASYSLYLTHVYVILAFSQVYARWPTGQNGWPKTALVAGCIVACAAVAAACHVLVERPLTAWARRLLRA